MSAWFFAVSVTCYVCFFCQRCSWSLHTLQPPHKPRTLHLQGDTLPFQTLAIAPSASPSVCKASKRIFSSFFPYKRVRLFVFICCFFFPQKKYWLLPSCLSQKTFPVWFTIFSSLLSPWSVFVWLSPFVWKKPLCACFCGWRKQGVCLLVCRKRCFMCDSMYSLLLGTWRVFVWLSPSCVLRFKFSSTRGPVVGVRVGFTPTQTCGQRLGFGLTNPNLRIEVGRG